MLGRYFAKRNRAHNASHPVTGYVRSQRDVPVCDMRYGCRTMDYNGCEVIACHHALLSLGIPSSLADMAEICSGLGLWFFGLFGTRPRALYRFCKKYGLSARRYRTRALSAIWEDVVLYAYWNPRFRGIHTVELHRTQTGYVVTNLAYLRHAVFPTMGEAVAAIRTPLPVLCLGVAKNPDSTGNPAKL